MSDQTPPENAQPDGTEPTEPVEQPEPTAVIPPPPAPEPTAPLPAFEAPAAATTSASRGTRRTAIIVAVAVFVAVVLGGGAFAIYKVFFAGGPQPAEALPDSTIAILTIDLNPSAGQKIAAIKAIRKFPALKEKLGLQSQDDLRKFVFDKAIEGTDCKDLSYSQDVKPWIGKRAAVAAVDLGGKDPVPAIALQITDKSKAKAGAEKIEKCANFGSDFGFAVGDDYLIASDSTAHAQQIVDDGKKHPLSKDADYKKWTGKAGDQGVVNFYVSKKASDYLADGLDELSKSFTDGLTGGSSDPFSSSSDDFGSYSGESAPRASTCSDDPLSAVKDQLKNFQGLAGTIRFADGGMELSVATQGISQLDSNATVGDKIAQLPSDTAIAMGFGVPDDYASKLVDSLKCGSGSGSDVVAQAEQETGMTLPGDLQTLLGSALTLSLGGDAPASLQDTQGPADIPVGLQIRGDADKIQSIITKIEQAVGYQLSDIQIGAKTSDDRLVLSPSESYADQLLKNGSLGDDHTFKDAVPNAKRDAGIFYVDFDSKWRQTIVDFLRDQGASADDVQLADENSKPLKALGISTWTENGTSHVLVKLTTN